MKKFAFLLIILTVIALGACGRAETLEPYAEPEPALAEPAPSPTPVEEALPPAMDLEETELAEYDYVENASEYANDYSSMSEQYEESAVEDDDAEDDLAYGDSAEDLDEPTDSQPDVNEIIPQPDLLGTWRWDISPAFYFTLNADGTGSGTGGMTFRWSTVGTDVLRKAYTGEVEYMYFELEGDTLILFGEIAGDYSRYLRD